MAQRWEMTKNAVASQNIEHEPRIYGAVWPADILVAYVGDIWGKPSHLQGEFTYITLEMHDGVLA